MFDFVLNSEMKLIVSLYKSDNTAATSAGTTISIVDPDGLTLFTETSSGVTHEGNGVWSFVLHGYVPVTSASALDIDNATNATPIVITTSSAHGYSNGDIVTISGVLGNTAANGRFLVANKTATTFELAESVGNGAYIAGTGDKSNRYYITKVGTYSATWRSATDSLVYVSTFTVGKELVKGYTKKDLRWAIARLVEGPEGFYQGTVDSAPSGTTWVDDARQEPDDHFVGWWMYVYGGTGVGSERRITDFVNSTTTFTMKPSLTVTSSSTYELHRYFQNEHFNEAIRLAFFDVKDSVFIPITDDYSLSVASSSFEYNIPSGFSHIYKVEINLTSDMWIEVAPAGWEVNRADRKLKLVPRVAYNFSGKKIRVSGLRPAYEPVNDSMLIDIRPEFVMYKAAAWLCMSKSTSVSDLWYQKFQTYEALAQQEKTFLNKNLPNNTRRIES